MDPDVQSRLDQQDILLNKIHVSVEKTRKYIFWTSVFTVIFFVLPLVASIFIVPSLIANINQMYGIGTTLAP